MPGSVFKRGKYWHIKFYHQGRAYQTSTKTTKKKEAEKLLNRYLSQVIAGTFKGFRNTDVSTKDILDDFTKDCARRKLRSLDTIVHHLKPIRRFFEPIDPRLITAADIRAYRTKREKEGKAPATINRGLHYLGQALRMAQEQELIERVPKIRLEPEDNARQGFFEHGEFERVVLHLPEDLKDFARFAYYSGWRRSEIASLQWSHIEEDVLRLPPELSKTKDGRVLILDGELHAIIDRRRAVRQLELVFYRTIKNRPGLQPVKTFYKAWETACKLAGVTRYFHDFRRTAVRNMDRAGVPRRVAKQISGHKTDMIFDRYRIVNEQDIREGVQRTQKHLRGQSSDRAEDGSI